MTDRYRMLASFNRWANERIYAKAAGLTDAGRDGRFGRGLAQRRHIFFLSASATAVRPMSRVAAGHANATYSGRGKMDCFVPSC